MFVEHVVVPHKEQIMNKNDSFFLDSDADAFVDNADDKAMEIVHTIKGYWKTMDEKTKNNLWLHFQVLIKLAEKANQS